MNKNKTRRLTIKQKIKMNITSFYYWFKFSLRPHNVLVLNKLPKGEYDTSTRMEESIFHLLNEFFDKEQPFHLPSGNTYEKNPSVHRHRVLMMEVYDNNDPLNEEIISDYLILLGIIQWYREGKNDRDFAANNSAFMNGSDFESHNVVDKALQEDIDKKLMFVIKHRSMLWT